MEAKEKPNILLDMLDEVPPASDSLVGIYAGLDIAVIEAEEGRLRERFLDVAGRLIAISEMRDGRQ